LILEPLNTWLGIKVFFPAYMIFLIHQFVLLMNLHVRLVALERPTTSMAKTIKTGTFGKIYNSGWKKHPNFNWKDQKMPISPQDLTKGTIHHHG
jgi:hypothetical protein